MNKQTKCWMTNFDPDTRTAILELADTEDFSKITIKEGGATITEEAWQTTIGKAREIRFNSQQSGKPYAFKVVVQRPDESYRFAKPSEWILSPKKRAANRRFIEKRLQNLPVVKATGIRGIVGTLKG